MFAQRHIRAHESDIITRSLYFYPNTCNCLSTASLNQIKCATELRWLIDIWKRKKHIILRYSFRFCFHFAQSCYDAVLFVQWTTMKLRNQTKFDSNICSVVIGVYFLFFHKRSLYEKYFVLNCSEKIIFETDSGISFIRPYDWNTHKPAFDVNSNLVIKLPLWFQCVHVIVINNANYLSMLTELHLYVPLQW